MQSWLRIISSEPSDNARLCSTIARCDFCDRIYLRLHRTAQRFQMVHGEYIFRTLRANVGVYRPIATEEPSIQV